MSAMSLALLLTTATATVVGAAALHAAHGLRKQVSALRVELAARGELAAVHAGGLGASVPQARSGIGAVDARDEIRTAVAEALAEERERELAEARAFWAAQEARDAADAPSALGGTTGGGFEQSADDVAFYMPRQADFAGIEPTEREQRARREADWDQDERDLDGVAFQGFDMFDAFDDYAGLSAHPGASVADADEAAATPSPAAPAAEADGAQPGEFPEDSPELAAARRRHPSHPDFVPVRTPVMTDHERTVARLDVLAESRTALADVRPGPLGTLDVYVFADGTTLCMTPGHHETAERLAAALRDGEAPYLLGGSGVSGAYSLTFSCGAGEGADEHVYVLADRVIASL